MKRSTNTGIGKCGGDWVAADDGKMTPGQRQAFKSGSIAAQVDIEQRKREAEFVPIRIPNNAINE